MQPTTRPKTAIPRQMTRTMMAMGQPFGDPLAGGLEELPVVFISVNIVFCVFTAAGVKVVWRDSCGPASVKT